MPQFFYKTIIKISSVKTMKTHILDLIWPLTEAIHAGWACLGRLSVPSARQGCHLSSPAHSVRSLRHILMPETHAKNPKLKQETEQTSSEIASFGKENRSHHKSLEIRQNIPNRSTLSYLPFITKITRI